MRVRGTGEVARVLGTNEPRLADLIRRGKIDPPPQIIGNRRMWTDDDVERAAWAVGRFTSDGKHIIKQRGNEDESK